MFFDLESGGAVPAAAPIQTHYREAVRERERRFKTATEKVEKEKAESGSILDVKALRPMPEEQNRDQAAAASSAGKSGIYSQPDEVKLALSISREERQVLVDVFAGGKDPASLSEESRENLRKSSERISKYLDEAMAKSKSDRERVEKAFGEWFSRLTRGERQGPLDLIKLLHQAAMGTLDGAAETAE